MPNTELRSNVLHFGTNPDFSASSGLLSLSFQGTGTFFINSSIPATDTTTAALVITGGIAAANASIGNLYTSYIESNSGYTKNLEMTAGSFLNIVGNYAQINTIVSSNLSVTSGSAINLLATNYTGTNLQVTAGSITSLVATSVSAANILSTRITTESLLVTGTSGSTTITGPVITSSTTTETMVFSQGLTTQIGPKMIGSGYSGSVAIQGNLYMDNSIAISYDGNTAVIGSAGGGSSTTDGTAWVFTRSSGNNTWSQLSSKLTIASTVSANQAIVAVAISGDSNTIALGRPGDTGNFGASYIFVRTANTFVQQAKLMGSGYSVGGGFQGPSVSLSYDGNTFAVGAYLENSSIGASWIFVRTNSVWSQQGDKLVGSGYSGTPRQGISVSLTSDGNTLAIGGSYDVSNVFGAVWIFSRSVGVWSQQGSKYVSSSSNNIGQNTNISGDGSVFITSGYTNPGGVEVFVRSGAGYIRQTRIVASGFSGITTQYGFSLSTDGKKMVIGSFQDTNGTANTVGSLFVFTRSVDGLTWSQGPKITASGYSGPSPQFASSVALSGDGSIMTVAAQGDMGGTIDGTIGALYFFNNNVGSFNILGNANIQNSSNIGGSLTVNGGIPATSTASGTLTISGGLGVSGDVYSNSVYSSTSTISNMFISVASIGTLVGFTGGATAYANLIGTNYTGVNLQVTTGSIANLAATAATATNMFISVASIGTLVGFTGGATAYTNLIGTNYTGVNLQVTTGSIANLAATAATATNMFISVACIGTLVGFAGAGSTAYTNLIATNYTGTNLQVTIGSIANLAATAASATNMFISVACIGTLVGFAGAGSTAYTNLIATNYTGTNLQVTSQTTESLLVTGGSGSTTITGSVITSSTITETMVFTQGLTTQVGIKLVGSGYSGTSTQQGFSQATTSANAVSVSNDGNTAVVSSNGGGSSATNGTAWVFVRSTGNNTWSQFGSKFVLSGEIGDSAATVFISGDSNTISVGKGSDNSYIGATWIFVRTTGTFVYQTKLVGSGFTGSPLYQGVDTSLSYDGNTIAISGSGDNGTTGAAWIFVRTNSTWSQSGNKLVGSVSVGGSYAGHNVALSGDGNTVLTGAILDGQGTVFVFSRSTGNNTWSQVGNKLVGSAGGVGMNLSISADGSIFTTSGYSIFNTNIFIRSGPSYVQQSRIVASGFSGTTTQYGLVLSADGKKLVIGSYLDQNGTANALGSLFVFTRSIDGQSWIQGPKIMASGYSGSAPQFASYVGLSGDGSIMVSAAQSDTGGTAGVTGAVYFFNNNIGSFNVLGNANIQNNVNIAGSLAVTGDLFSNSVYAPVSTISNMFISVACIGTLVGFSGGATAYANLIGTNYTGTNLQVTTGSIANLAATVASVTNLIGTNYTGTNLQVTTGSILNFAATVASVANLIGTNYTGTNLQVTTGSIANLATTVASVTNLIGTNYTGINLQVTRGSIANLAATAATATNMFISVACIGTLVGFSGGATAYANLIATNYTGTNLQVTASLLVTGGSGSTTIAGSVITSSTLSETMVFTNLTTLNGQKMVGSGYSGTLILQGHYSNFTDNSVAISYDGNTAIIGSVFGGGPTGLDGTIWVFARSVGNNTWSQLSSKLTLNSTSTSCRVTSLAISGDSNTIALGRGQDNSNLGGTFIFVRTANTFTQQAMLIGSGYAGSAEQGFSVSLSYNGNTLAIGSTADNAFLGATWIFTRTGTTWYQEGNKLVGSGYSPGASLQILQGSSVSLTSDGNTVAIGARLDYNAPAAASGSVWIFARSAGIWSQQGSKYVNSGAISQIGHQTNISGDGSTFITSSGEAGQNVIVFVKLNNVYSRQNVILASGFSGITNAYGYAISADGKKFVIGSSQDTGGTANALGAIFLFTRSSDGLTWSQGPKIVASGYSGSSPQFASTASLSGDGSVMAVGSQGDVTVNTDSSTGALYLFDNNFGALNIQGSVNIGNSLAVTGSAIVSGDLYVSGDIGDGEASTSIYTGALTVNGGLGVVGDIYSNSLYTPMSTISNMFISVACIGTLLSTGNTAYTNLIATNYTGVNLQVTTGTVVNLQVTTGTAVNLSTTSASIGGFSAGQGSISIGTIVNLAVTSASIGGFSAGQGSISIGTILNLAVTSASIGSFTAGNALISSGSMVNLAITSASIGSFTAGNALISIGSIVNLAVTSASIGSFTAGRASISIGTVVNLAVTSASIGSFTAGNALISSGSIVNLAVTSASIGSFTAGNALISSGSIVNLAVTSASIGSFTAGNALISIGTVVNLAVTSASIGSFTAGRASISIGTVVNLAVTSASIGSFTSGNALISSGSIVNLAVTSASIGSFTAGNALISSGSIVNLAVTSASIGGFSAAQGTIANLAVTSASIGGFSAAQGSISIGTIVNLAVTSASIGGFSGGRGSISIGTIVNLAVTSASIGGFSAGQGSISIGTILNLAVTSASIGSFTAGNALISIGTIVNLSITSISSANISSTNMTTTSLTVTGASGSTTIAGSVITSSTLSETMVFTTLTTTLNGQKMVGSGYSGTRILQGMVNGLTDNTVAISYDGNTAVIGSQGGGGLSINDGTAWIFTRSVGNNTWSQLSSKLTLNSTATQSWISSLAISGDSNTIALGRTAENGNLGGTFIFVRTAATFAQQARLLGSGYSGLIGQGVAVSLSYDGNTLAVGGTADSSNIGASWIFIRTGTTWSQQGDKIVGSGYSGACNQGISLSLTSDGNTLAVGGHQDPTGSATGAVWIFARSAGTWSQQGYKYVNSGAGTPIGFQTNISGDGSTFITSGHVSSFSVLVFVKSNNVYSRQNIIAASGFSGATLAIGYALSADGKKFVIGASSDTGGTTGNVGALFLFTRSADGLSWTQGRKIVASGYSGPSPQFSSTATLSGDGSVIAVGSMGDVADTNSSTGALYFFDNNFGALNIQGSVNIGNSLAVTGSATVSGDLYVTGNIGDGEESTSIYTGALTVNGGLGVSGNIYVTNLITSGENSMTLSGSSITSATSSETMIFTPSVIQKGNKLVGSGGTVNSQQGRYTAISMDSTTLVISAADGDMPITYIFIRSSGNNLWSQQGSKLIASGYSGTVASQTLPVSIAADGNTFALGYAQDNASTGATWVFARSTGNSTWSLIGGSKLVGSGTSGTTTAAQGTSVAISDDGFTLASGGTGDYAITGGAVGAVWIFVRSTNNSWLQQTKLIGSGFSGFTSGGVGAGQSVSLSSSGNTLAFGGNLDRSSSTTNPGSVWVFSRSTGNSVWSIMGAKLIGSGNSSAYFGYTVSLNSNADVLAVGGYLDNDSYGATWIFTRTGTIWTQFASKIVGSGVSGFFGYNVSLNSPGNIVAIGAQNDSSGFGATFIYMASADKTYWARQSKIIGSGYSGFGNQGSAVSINGDGTIVISGAQSDNNNYGAVWVFNADYGALNVNASLNVGNNLNLSGVLSATNQPSCLLTGSVTIAMSTTTSYLMFYDTVLYNTSPAIIIPTSTTGSTGSYGKIVVKQTGLYYISYSTPIGAATASCTAAAWFSINTEASSNTDHSINSYAFVEFNSGASTSNLSSSASAVVYLQVDDYITFWAGITVGSMSSGSPPSASYKRVISITKLF
jgi:hypothetical protein